MQDRIQEQINNQIIKEQAILNYFIKELNGVIDQYRQEISAKVNNKDFMSFYLQMRSAAELVESIGVKGLKNLNDQLECATTHAASKILRELKEALTSGKTRSKVISLIDYSGKCASPSEPIAKQDHQQKSIAEQNCRQVLSAMENFSFIYGAIFDASEEHDIKKIEQIMSECVTHDSVCAVYFYALPKTLRELFTGWMFPGGLAPQLKSFGDRSGEGDISDFSDICDIYERCAEDLCDILDLKKIMTLQPSMSTSTLPSSSSSSITPVTDSSEVSQGSKYDSSAIPKATSVSHGLSTSSNALFAYEAKLSIAGSSSTSSSQKS